ATAIELVVLHRSLPERLDDATLNLALDALRVDRAADVVRCPDAEHLHLAGDSIDLDLRHLRAKNVGLPRPSGTIDRMHTGGIRAEGGGPARDNTAFFCRADGFAHGNAMVGVFGPDFTVAGADRLGINIPNHRHDIDKTLAGLARGQRHRIADHVGLTARSRV